MHQLYAIGFSPWSTRVRWTLNHQGVPYKLVPYVPTASELGLRWRLGRLRGRLTVPVLFPEDGPPLDDGLAIAAWAAPKGPHALVSDSPDFAQHLAWADQALHAGRVRATERMLASPEALRASVPKPLRNVGPLAEALARKTATGLLSKYSHLVQGDPLTQLTDALAQLEKALARRTHLADSPSFADFSVMAAMDFIAPRDDLPVSRATRPLWSEPELAERFASLVAWRDARLAERAPSSRVHG